jgi:tetratricopeptide (TPR) repeat protein
MSVEFVREWKEAHAGGKSIITLSLRQTNYGLQRNSNLSAWVEFAHYLEKKSYFPVFVRDTYDVFRGMPTELKGFTCLDAASINLEIRMAIYSKSAAVLGNTSGPTVLCWFGGVPCLAFKSVEPTWHDTHPQSIKSSLGIEVGTQPPFLSSNQRYIWEDTDSFDTIVSAFEEIEPSLDTPPPITAPPPTDLNSPEQFQSLSDFSRDLIDAHSYRAARIVLLALLEQEPKNASYQHKMGIVFTRMQCFDEAKIKLDSAAALDDENADIRVSIGDLHLMLGNTSEASSAFNLAIELNPKCSNGYLRLGLIMERSGLSGQAVLLFEKALEVAPKNAQAMRLLANCYNEVGLKDKANTLLDHANLVDPKNEGDSL